MIEGESNVYECTVFIPKNLGAPDFVKHILGSLETFSQAQFSCDETDFSEADVLSDLPRFDEFSVKNGDDFILKTPSGDIFSFFSKGDVIICSGFIDKLGEVEKYRQYLITSIEFGCLFGFLCDQDEFMHRNRIGLDLGTMRVESWVGRDVSRYVPGLYYLMAISNPLLLSLRVEEESLEGLGRFLDRKAPGGRLFEFYDDIDKWKEFAGYLDKLCVEMDWIFSKSLAERQLVGVKNFREAQNVLKNWR